MQPPHAPAHTHTPGGGPTPHTHTPLGCVCKVRRVKSEEGDVCEERSEGGVKRGERRKRREDVNVCE